MFGNVLATKKMLLWVNASVVMASMFSISNVRASEISVDYSAVLVNSSGGRDQQNKIPSTADHSGVSSSNSIGCDVSLTPQSGQHFNLDAPMSAVKTNGTTSEKLSFKNREQNKLELHLEGCAPQDLLKTSVYICDDEKTFCVAKAMTFSLRSGSGHLESVVSSSGEKSETESSSQAVDFKSVLDRAKSENKLVFIDFFGRWCPPCNLMDETVLSTKLFRDLEKQFVIFKVDVDAVASWDLKTRYAVKGYPTYVLANASGEEIFRIVGSRKPRAFFKSVQQAIRYKGLSLQQRQKKALGVGGSQEAYELGMMYLAQQDYLLALRYFNVASPSWAKGSNRFHDLEEAQLGVVGAMKEEKDKRIYAEMLGDAIRRDPVSVRTYNYQEMLLGVLEDLNDTEKKNALLISQEATVKMLLKNPKKLQNEELSQGDLYVALAQIEKTRKNEASATTLYVKAYDFFTDELKRLGLNEKTNRGINFDRLYCLGKAKRYDDAEKKYQDLEQIYPSEFTFFYLHSKMLKDQEKFDRSIATAEKAFELSYGDNRLRVAGFLSALYAQMDQKQNAIKIIDQTLASVQAPEDKTLRVHKELAKLEAQKATYQKELAGKVTPPVK